MEKNAVKSVWADAPKGGAVIGIIVTAVLFLKVWLTASGAGAGLGWLISMAEFCAVGYCIYYFSRERGRMYGWMGYSYGQSMGYIMAMMLFAGFIYGVGYYFLVNYISAGYFSDMFDQMFEQMRGMLGGLMTDESVDMTYRALRNPFYWIFYGVVAMLIYGGILGLFASAFVKRSPDMFNHDNERES